MKRVLSPFVLAATSTCHAQTITSDAPLSREQKREIVSFVREIASAPWNVYPDFQSYDFQNGNPPNDALISFGIYHTALRSYSRFRKGKTAGDISLDASHVSRVALKYLGRAPRHRSIIKMDAGQGGGYFWTLRGGSYHGFGEVFEQQSNETLQRVRIQNARSKQPIVTAQWPDLTGDGAIRARMTLRRVGSGSQARWILWSYKSLSPRA